MILVADCGDSFVHNLSAMIASSGHDVLTVPEDRCLQVSPRDVEAVVLSPGPGRPYPGRGSWGLYSAYLDSVPVLGVCLGHQTICAFHGAGIARGGGPMHGKLVSVEHSGRGLFEGVPQGFSAVRYNSLCAMVPEGSPLRVEARDGRGDVMAVSLPGHPVYGVQFHPESFLTEHGERVVGNFLREADRCA